MPATWEVFMAGIESAGLRARRLTGATNNLNYEPRPWQSSQDIFHSHGWIIFAAAGYLSGVAEAETEGDHNVQSRNPN